MTFHNTASPEPRKEEEKGRRTVQGTEAKWN
jgi:hypothetical protein